MGDELSLRAVPDDELLRRLSDLTHESRRVEADLVAHIGEVDVRRLYARERLEFHHRRPFARGGEHSVENLVLVCRAHNALLAELDYGKEKMARHGRWAGLFSAGTTGWDVRRASC